MWRKASFTGDQSLKMDKVVYTEKHLNAEWIYNVIILSNIFNNYSTKSSRTWADSHRGASREPCMYMYDEIEWNNCFIMSTDNHSIVRNITFVFIFSSANRFAVVENLQLSPLVVYELIAY